MSKRNDETEAVVSETTSDQGASLGEEMPLLDIARSRGLTRTANRVLKNATGEVIKTFKVASPEPLLVGLMYAKGWTLKSLLRPSEFDRIWSAFTERKLGAPNPE